MHDHQDHKLVPLVAIKPSAGRQAERLGSTFEGETLGLGSEVSPHGSGQEAERRRAGQRVRRLYRSSLPLLWRQHLRLSLMLFRSPSVFFISLFLYLFE
jgi:hypothetical protein